MPEVVRVVLAAGAARRFGSAKLLAAFDGRTLLARALDACGEAPSIVVASHEVALHVAASTKRRVIINTEPARGMTHSLKLALACLPADAAVAVLLADLPYVTRGLVDRVVGCYSASIDVVSPEHDGRPAHPVVFGPRALALLGAMADGDTLRGLRADSRLVRFPMPIDDVGSVMDVDSPADLARAAAWNQSPT